MIFMAVMFIFIQFVGFKYGYSVPQAMSHHVDSTQLYYAPDYSQAKYDWDRMDNRIKDSGKPVIFYHGGYNNDKYIVAESNSTHSLTNMHNVNTNDWGRYEIEKSKAHLE